MAPTSPARLLRRLRDYNREERTVRMARAARERLPGDSALGDSLSTAGEGRSELLARYLTEVDERPSAVRELGLGLLQVYQSMSEASGRGRGERGVAILFTDLVAFSSWALEAGDGPALSLLRSVSDQVEGAIRDRRGEVVKRLGDGHMAAFDDPVAAVEAAWDAGGRLEAIEVAGYRPKLRSGVHFGRPRSLGGDYLGVDVNIAARLAAAASPQEVLVSEPVSARLDPEAVELRRRRWFRAKGTPRDLQVFAAAPR